MWVPWLVPTAALGAPELVRADATADGPGALTDTADVVLLYAGEQRGEIGPCGCGRSGGLPKLATYAEEVRRASPSALVLLLDPGEWLSCISGDQGLTGWSATTNAWYHRALDVLPFDALNATYRDLPGAAAAPRPGLVSATHRPSAVPVPRYASFERDGVKVAVTGASRRGLDALQPQGTEVRPPVEAVRALLPELEHAGHDLVVVLAYELPVEAPVLADLPGVDVVIEANGYEERWPALTRGDALWVRSLAGGVRVGELRLWLDDQGRIARATDRQVMLGDRLDPDPRLLRLQRAQDEATR